MLTPADGPSAPFFNAAELEGVLKALQAASEVSVWKLEARMLEALCFLQSRMRVGGAPSQLLGFLFQRFPN